MKRYTVLMRGRRSEQRTRRQPIMQLVRNMVLCTDKEWSVLKGIPSLKSDVDFNQRRKNDGQDQETGEKR